MRQCASTTRDDAARTATDGACSFCVTQKFASLDEAQAFMREHGAKGHEGGVESVDSGNGQIGDFRELSRDGVAGEARIGAKVMKNEGKVKSASSKRASAMPGARAKSTMIGERVAGLTSSARDGDEPDMNRAVDAYVVEFDGASRGNPGFAGAGALLKRKKDDRIVEELTEYLGNDRTVNEAEYAALCLGLRKAVELGITHIECKGDSKLIVNQVKGLFQCKSDKLAPMHAEAMRLKKEFSSFSIEHVRREYNKHADHLANMAVDFGLTPTKMTGFEAGGGGLRNGADVDGDDEVIFKRRKVDGFFTPLGWASSSKSARGAHTLARAAHRPPHDGGSADDRAMTSSAPIIFGASSARNAWASRRAWVPMTRALVGFARMRL